AAPATWVLWRRRCGSSRTRPAAGAGRPASRGPQRRQARQDVADARGRREPSSARRLDGPGAALLGWKTRQDTAGRSHQRRDAGVGRPAEGPTLLDLTEDRDREVLLEPGAGAEPGVVREVEQDLRAVRGEMGRQV